MIILLPPIQAALITISVFNGGVKKFPIKKKCRWALSHAYPSCADINIRVQRRDQAIKNAHTNKVSALYKYAALQITAC